MLYSVLLNEKSCLLPRSTPYLNVYCVSHDDIFVVDALYFMYVAGNFGHGRKLVFFVSAVKPLSIPILVGVEQLLLILYAMMLHIPHTGQAVFLLRRFKVTLCKSL